MNIFKRIFRRPAILLVTIWARRTYRQGVAAADERHRKEGEMIYLAADSWKPDRLVTYNKAQFKAEKRVYGMAARTLTMNTLRSGCYYHTADRIGGNRMTDRDIIKRRKAFVKERLRLAGLLTKPGRAE